MSIYHKLQNVAHRIKKATPAIFMVSIIGLSCKKILSIPPPPNSVTDAQVFSNDIEATSAMNGIYYKMINGVGMLFSKGGMTIYTGASSDELTFFNQSDINNKQFQNNKILANSPLVLNNFWTPAYSIIYSANAIIENLQISTGVHDSVRKELTGEAKFARALCYFYLTNLFGDLPYASTTDWKSTNLLSRTLSSSIYQSIVADLKDAQNALPEDYSVGNEERIIPNKYAAAALLARVYLYLKEWQNADDLATMVINNNSLYSLTSLDAVFYANSSESIFQLQQSNLISPYNATPEGNQIIPKTHKLQPYVYLTTQLLNSFDSGDLRKTYWIDSTIYSGKTYYYPRKYQIGPGQATAGGPYTEYYTVLRLAEQYLIRAEAKIHENKLDEGTNDVNLLRARANLPAIPLSTLTQQQLLDVLMQERKIELFAEWGHRWLDLKRTNLATPALDTLKPQWNENSLLYPIPTSELISDPNLKQNLGY